MTMLYRILYVAIFIFSCRVLMASAKDSFPASNTGMQFIQNKHQWNDKILFRADVKGGTVFLEKNILTWSFYSIDDLNSIHEAMHEPSSQSHISSYPVHCHAYKMHFDGANQSPVISGT